jgi:hypothetical protein
MTLIFTRLCKVACYLALTGGTGILISAALYCIIERPDWTQSQVLRNLWPIYLPTGLAMFAAAFGIRRIG